MAPLHSFTTVLVATLLLLAISTSNVLIDTASADCEEDLAALEEELNATQRELKEVKEDRDEISQRLEDQTSILIIVMFLLVGSYIFFYLNTRRAKIAFLEYQKRTGATPEGETRPRRRRRG